MNPEIDSDSEVLAKLLREYTTSLRSILHSRDSLQSRWFLTMALLSIALTIPTFLISRYGESSGSFYVTMTASVIAIMVGAYFLFAIQSQRRFLYDEVEVIADKLAKIVRHASQQMEHGQPSFGIRLELDLRLTEAESVLRIADRFRSRYSMEGRSETGRRDDESMRP